MIQRSRSGLTMLSRHSVGSYQENELIRNSSGNTRQQSSQPAEPPWTDPGLKSGNGVYKHISTKKKRKKKAHAGTESCHPPRNSWRAREKPPNECMALSSPGSARPVLRGKCRRCCSRPSDKRNFRRSIVNATHRSRGTDEQALDKM